MANVSAAKNDIPTTPPHSNSDDVAAGPGYDPLTGKADVISNPQGGSESKFHLDPVVSTPFLFKIMDVDNEYLGKFHLAGIGPTLAGGGQFTYGNFVGLFTAGGGSTFFWTQATSDGGKSTLREDNFDLTLSPGIKVLGNRLTLSAALILSATHLFSPDCANRMSCGLSYGDTNLRQPLDKWVPTVGSKIGINLNDIINLGSAYVGIGAVIGAERIFAEAPVSTKSNIGQNFNALSTGLNLTFTLQSQRSSGNKNASASRK